MSSLFESQSTYDDGSQTRNPDSFLIANFGKNSLLATDVQPTTAGVGIRDAL